MGSGHEVPVGRGEAGWGGKDSIYQSNFRIFFCKDNEVLGLYFYFPQFTVLNKTSLTK